MAKKKSGKQEQRDSSAAIPVEQAASAAATYLGKLIPTAAGVRIEETELGADGAAWLITLSYHEGLAFGPRQYKMLRVDALTGEVLSMKIREV